MAAGPATAIAVASTYQADLLGTERYTTPAAIAQGQDAALAIGLCMAGAFLLRLVLLPADAALSRFHLPVRVRRPVIGGLVATARSSSWRSQWRSTPRDI